MSRSGFLLPGVVALALTGCTQPPPVTTTTDLATYQPVLPSSTTPDGPEIAATPVATEIAAVQAGAVATLPQTDEGAASFVVFWFSSLNAAYQDGQGDRMQGLSATDCTACQDYLDRLDDVTSDGSRTVEAPFAITGAHAEGADSEVAEVQFTYLVHDVQVLAPAGSRRRITGQAATPALAAVLWQDDHWVMGQVGR